MSDSVPPRVRDSEDVVRELRETFAYFDRDRDGSISATEFCEVVRALGYAPSEMEISALQRTIDRIYSGSLNFSNFVKVVSTIVQPKMKRPSECGPAIQKSFADFESLCRGRNDGTVSAKDLQSILTRHGDPIDVESFVQLLHFTGLDGLSTEDVVDYKSLIDTLMAAAVAADA